MMRGALHKGVPRSTSRTTHTSRRGRPITHKVGLNLSDGVKNLAFRDRHLFVALNAQAERSRRVSRSTIPYNDRFGLLAVGALKTSPLMLQVDWLNEGDVHGRAAPGARIAGRGSPARLGFFAVRHAGSLLPFRQCGTRQNMPSPKEGAA